MFANFAIIAFSIVESIYENCPSIRYMPILRCLTLKKIFVMLKPYSVPLDRLGILERLLFAWAIIAPTFSCWTTYALSVSLLLVISIMAGSNDFSTVFSIVR